MSDPARWRWLALAGVRIVAAIGAVLGVILLARADAWGPKVIGLLWVLASLWLMAVIPAALARRWRSGAK